MNLYSTGLSSFIHSRPKEDNPALYRFILPGENEGGELSFTPRWRSNPCGVTKGGVRELVN